MSDYLRVVAELASPLAGDAPQLDALLEYVMSMHHGCGGGKLARGRPAPPQGAMPIPLLRRRLGPWLVGACSDPIYSDPTADVAEYVCKRIEPDGSRLLDPAERKKMLTGGTWTKSYRLPIRTRTIDRIVWFAVADRKPLYKALKQAGAVGVKTSVGYGRVSRWTVDRIDDDWSWYAPHDGGSMLMSTLPAGDWLPANLVGFRADFGAATPPYWHPDRYTEIVKPC